MLASLQLASLRLFGFVLLFVVAASPGQSWGQDYSNLDKTQVNQGRVGIISGGIKGTYVKFAADLANVLDDGNKLRIVPMLGKGSVQNIVDILLLEGVDIGIVQSDVLESIRQTSRGSYIATKIHYITKLYNEEIHILARQEFSSLAELQGRTVNFGKQGSGTAMTAKIVFDAGGVSVKPVNLPQQDALAELRAGNIDALVYVAGKPTELFSDPSIGSYARFIPVPHSATWANKSYLPGTLTADDYPALVETGETIDTIAVGAVMAVYNWAPGEARYKRTAKFVQAFFERFDEFRKLDQDGKPLRHRKWQEVFLEAEVGGWTRFKPASEALATRSPGAGAIAKAPEDYLGSFEDFDKRYLKVRGLGDLPLVSKQKLFADFRASHGFQ